jgi:hypothetical protein
VQHGAHARRQLEEVRVRETAGRWLRHLAVCRVLHGHASDHPLRLTTS